MKSFIGSYTEILFTSQFFFPLVIAVKKIQYCTLALSEDEGFLLI